MEKLQKKIQETKFKEDLIEEKKIPKIIIENEDASSRRLLLKSDYETASEFNPDFHSDNEPPSDKIHEERLITKRNDFRIYKKIIKVGKKGDMPSKYNKITYKFKKRNLENLEENCLEEEEWLTHQMGIDKEELTEVKLNCLQNMKKGELSSFRVEIINYDKEKHQRNLVKQYWYNFEVKDWETIIDIYGDFICMKNILKKGNGVERLKISDEGQLSVFLQGNLEKFNRPIFKKQLQEGEQIYESLPDSLQELTCNMKKGEMSVIEIRREFFEKYEKDEKFLKEILDVYDKEEENEKDGYCVKAVLHLPNLVKVDDLFNDGTVFKKTIMGSYSTAKPDLHSRIYFDFRIFDKNGEILYNGLENQLNARQEDDLNFQLYENSTCLKNFLDDYSLSKAMRIGLKFSKKLEKFELKILNPSKMEDGFDTEKIKSKITEEKKFEDFFPLKYEVKVYTFSLGDNAYTMGITDKKNCFKDRKPALVNQLLNKKYRRALKLLSFLKEILENVIIHISKLY